MKRSPELKPNFWDGIVALAVIALAAAAALTVWQSQPGERRTDGRGLQANGRRSTALSRRILKTSRVPTHITATP